MNAHKFGSVTLWTARFLGTLFFGFIAFFVVAHALSPEDGLPRVWGEPLRVQLLFLALFLVAIGGIVGWKWEGVAAVMVLVGTALWVLVERDLPWPRGGTLLIGVLYAFAYWCTKRPFTPRTHATR